MRKILGMCLCLWSGGIFALSNGCGDVRGKTDRRVSDLIWQEIQAQNWTFDSGEILRVTFSNPSKSGASARINVGTSAASGVAAVWSTVATSDTFPVTLEYQLSQNRTFVEFDMTSGNVDLSGMDCGASQIITFDTPDDAQMGSGTKTLVGSSDSGLVVAFESETTSICTVSSTTLTLVSDGTCTITASQEGNSPTGDYFAATDVTRSFTITAAPAPAPPEEEEEEEVVEEVVEEEEEVVEEEEEEEEVVNTPPPPPAPPVVFVDYQPNLLLDQSVTDVARAYASVTRDYFRSFSQPLNSRFAYLGRSCHSEETEEKIEHIDCSHQGIQFTFTDPSMEFISENVDLNPSGNAGAAGWSVWSEGQVTVGDWDSLLSSDNVLLGIGSDRALGKYTRGGLALTASWQSARINPSDDVDADNYGLSLYGSMRAREIPVVLEGILGASDLDITSTRADRSQTFSADRDGTMVFSSIGVRSLDSIGQRLQITPHGRFELGTAHIKGESETGGLWAVQYGQQVIDYQMVFIGLDVDYRWALEEAVIRPFGSTEYGYSFSQREDVTMKYAGGTKYYNLVLKDQTDATVRIQLGLDYMSDRGFTSALVYTRNQALGGGHSDGARIYINLPF